MENEAVDQGTHAGVLDGFLTQVSVPVRRAVSPPERSDPHGVGMDHTTQRHNHPSVGNGTIAGHAPVLIRLHDEWRHLSISAAELRAVRRWALPGSLVDSLDDVLVRCGFSAEAKSRDSGDRNVESAASDEVLLRLLELAPSEALAARIVLQRILPPLCAVARRHTNNKQQRLELMDELVANAWPIICRYPVERRRVRVVPNLVRDITFETIVRPSRRRGASEIPTETGAFDDPADVVSVEPIEELVELLRDAADVVGVMPGDVAFICQLINHGRPEQLAVALDVTPRTVRNHRDAIVHRLRTLVACAA